VTRAVRVRSGSSGREPFVFRVKSPEGLPGRHAENMAAAINPGEKLHYLIYSPMWNGDKTPFGLEAIPASHAVAVTDRRFVLSIDSHVELQPPTLEEVPFERLGGVELGSALLLGWLVFRILEEDTVATKALLFRATGSRHFEAAVRAYRSLSAGIGRESPSTPAITWAEARARAPHSFSEIGPLLLEEEQPQSCEFSPPVWRQTRAPRKGWISLAPASFFLLTTHGLFSVVEESGPCPDVMGYGLNVDLFQYPAIQWVELADPTDSSSPCATLRVVLACESSSWHMDFPVAGGRSAEMRRFASLANELVSRGEYNAVRRS